MKKIIFFDIDGTIATEDERGFIPDSTRRAIAQARANGHLTFINSGRTIFNIGNNIRELGFDGYICGCGTYIEYNDEVLLYNKLDRAVLPKNRRSSLRMQSYACLRTQRLHFFR